MPKESLWFEAGLGISKFAAGISGIQKLAATGAKNVVSEFSGLAGKIGAIGAAVGVSFTAAAFAGGVKGAFDLGDALGEMSARTGVAIKTLLPLQQVLKDSGVEAEDLATAIAKMQKGLAGGGGFLAKVLGDSLPKFKGMAPDEQFVNVGKAIASIKDPAEKTAAAMEIFGKSGAKLLAAFSDPNFGKVAPELANQAALLQRNAEIFGAVSDELGKSGNTLRGFFLGFAEEAAPAVLKALQEFKKIDLVAQGKAFADEMGRAAAFMVAVGKGGAGMAGRTKDIITGVLDYLLFDAGKINGEPTVHDKVAADKASKLLGNPNAKMFEKKGFFSGTDPRSGAIFKSKSADPFMSDEERVAFNARRMESGEMTDAEWQNRFRGGTKSLEKWGREMGVKDSAYHQVRSKTKEERAAIDAKEKETKISEQSMKTLGETVKAGMKEAVKEVVAE